LQLENKVAVVTGSSQSIGRAIALVFAREGAAVTVDYRSHPDEAQAVVEEIEGSGGRPPSASKSSRYVRRNWWKAALRNSSRWSKRAA
jgi:NAD(P)-dependent dehydrogenase (short-subunit alcohol dehydrogenase family)